MRGDQTIRQWKIIRFLVSSKTGKTVQEIITHINPNCHQRTVYRDLEVLQAAGFPLFTEKKDNNICNRKIWAWKLLKDDLWVG